MSAPPGGWSPSEPSSQGWGQQQNPAGGWQDPQSKPYPGSQSYHGSQGYGSPGYGSQPYASQPYPGQAQQPGQAWGAQPQGYGTPASMPSASQNAWTSPSADDGWGNNADGGWGSSAVAPQPPVGGPAPSMAPGPHAPQNLATSYQPGIIALKPLGLGDVIQGAAKLLRWNPKSTILLTLVCQGIGLLGAIPLGVFLARRAMGDHSSPTFVALGLLVTLLIAMLPMIVGQLVLLPLVQRVTLDGVLGKRTSIAEAWRTAKRRIWASIGTQLLVGLIILGVALVGIVLMVMVTMGATSIGQDNHNTAIGITVLGIVAIYFVMIVAMVIFYLRLAMATALVVFENASPVDAIKRSLKLSKNNAFRILGYSIVISLVTMVIAMVIGLPLQLISEVITQGALGGDSTSTEASVLSISLSLVQRTISGVITTPFTIAAMALLTIDMKMRQEGYDIELLTASQQVAPR